MDTSFLQKKQNFIGTFAIIGIVAAVLTALLLGAGASEVGLALGGGVVLGGIVIGTYTLGRRYGHPHSHAVAEATIALGSLVLLTITYRLLTEFGERSTGEVIGGLVGAIVGFSLFVALIVALGRYGPSPN